MVSSVLGSRQSALLSRPPRTHREGVGGSEDIFRVGSDEEAEERHALPADRSARSPIRVPAAPGPREVPPPSVVAQSQEANGESILGAQVHEALLGNHVGR